MEDLNNITTTNEALEGIDLKKLRNIINSNLLWIVLLIVSTNLTAYLIIRYTQPRYEAASELKLDVKQNATDLGFSEFIPEQQRVNLISGEIETIQSKSFLNQVIDSLNLHVSYYSIGKFLNTELYTSSPFTVWFGTIDPSFYDVPITIIPTDETHFQLREDGRELTIDGTYNDTLNFSGLPVVIRKNNDLKFIDENTYSFVINSREGLLQYLGDNLTVEPLIYEANTIRISFNDSNPIKARDLVNGIDSIYIMFSHNQKNLANKQKIEWLNSELSSIETKMESYENYFEEFTLKNRTSDLGSDLKETIKQINKIDSQRFEVNKRLIEVNKIIDAIGCQKSVKFWGKISNNKIETVYRKTDVFILQIIKSH